MAKANNAYIDEKTKLEIIRLYASGMNKNQIAKKLGVAYSTVNRWVGKTGLEESKNNDLKKIDMSNLSEKTIDDILTIRENISLIIGKVAEELDMVPVEKVKGVIDTLMVAHSYLLETNELSVKQEQALKIEIVGGRHEN
jgi:orotate phosphoribosyltransferase-like protein